MACGMSKRQGQMQNLGRILALTALQPLDTIPAAMGISSQADKTISGAGRLAVPDGGGEWTFGPDLPFRGQSRKANCQLAGEEEVGFLSSVFVPMTLAQPYCSIERKLIYGHRD
jgi:hypothetical protein